MSQLTVTTTAQLVPSGGSRDVRSLASNSATIFLGRDATVSPANGYPLEPSEAYSMPFGDTTQRTLIRPDLWVVVASGTADLRYL